jgi:hypothetical protein
MSFKKTLIGLLATSAGCSTLPSISQVDYQQTLTQAESSFDDPHNIKRYLEDNEYIVDQEVLSAFSKSLRDGFFIPKAVHLSKNYLDTDEEVDKFEELLGKSGYLENEVDSYMVLFSTPKTIILSDTAIVDKEETLRYLAHERFHQEMKKLGPLDYTLMEEVAEKLMKVRKPNTGDSLKMMQGVLEGIRKEYGEQAAKEHEIDLLSYYLAPAVVRMGMWEEVYAHTATGSAPKEIEEHIERLSPKAWDIYSAIKERVLNVEGYDKDVPLVF